MISFRLVQAAALTTIALAFSATAADGDEAMFGLKWGMAPKDVEALGTKIEKKESDRNLDTYKTTSLPKNLSETDYYFLVFADGKLAKISAIGKDITNDPSGSSGKARFDSIESALTTKYGKPSDKYQKVGAKLYKEYDEFYQCLAYSGCGLWYSMYKTPDKLIVLDIEGQRRGRGYVSVTVEAKPQWEIALDVYKNKKNSSDKDAL